MKTTTAVKKALGIAVLVATTISWSATVNSGTTDVGSLDTSFGIAQLPNSGEQAKSGEVGNAINLPEPSSLSLLAAGVVGLIAARRRVNKKALS